MVWDTGSLCVRVVRLPGLWDLALQRQDSTLLLCNTVSKAARSKLREQAAQTLTILPWHQDSSHRSLLACFVL